MKKKGLAIALLATSLSLGLGFNSFASWEQVGTQWKYSENNVYLSGWQWIDGNGDNIAECYYLDATGVMAVNTVIDNYTVNADGQWTINNIIQTKVVNTSGSSGRSESSQNQSNSGIPDLSDIIADVGHCDTSNMQGGDSTGLPPMQSGGSSGGSSSESQSPSTQTGGLHKIELGDGPLHLDPEWKQEFNEGIIRN